MDRESLTSVHEMFNWMDSEMYIKISYKIKIPKFDCTVLQKL